MSVSEVLYKIAKDMEDDATNFDGRPFNGWSGGQYFGYQAAAISVLAKFLKEHIEKEEG